MKARTKELVYEIILAVVVVSLVIILNKNAWLTFGVLAAVWAFAIYLWHKKIDIATFIVAAVVGPVVEIISIYYGIWSYADPMFLGIPVWLPLLWGFAGVLLRRIAETIVKK